MLNTDVVIYEAGHNQYAASCSMFPTIVFGADMTPEQPDLDKEDWEERNIDLQGGSPIAAAPESTHDAVSGFVWKIGDLFLGTVFDDQENRYCLADNEESATKWMQVVCQEWTDERLCNEEEVWLSNLQDAENED